MARTNVNRVRRAAPIGKTGSGLKSSRKKRTQSEQAAMKVLIDADLNNVAEVYALADALGGLLAVGSRGREGTLATLSSMLQNRLPRVRAIVEANARRFGVQVSHV